MNQSEVNARNSEAYLLRLAKSVIERLSNDSLVSIFRWLELLLYERTGFKVNSSAVTSTLLDESIRNEDEAPYTVGDSSIGATLSELSRVIDDSLFNAMLSDAARQLGCSVDELRGFCEGYHCQHCSMPDELCTCRSCSDCGSNINECRCDPDYEENLSLEDVL